MSPPAKSVNRTPSIGWGPFRFEWYSICSGHGRNKDGNYYGHDTDCPRCMAGTWVNCYVHEIESWLHDNHYEVWFWWANRPKYTIAEARKEARKYKNAR